MKIKIIISLLFAYSISFSQITITDLNLTQIGDVIYLSEDTSTIVNIGNTGQNQIWDFSNLISSYQWINEIVDPVTTPFDQSYPTSNMCIYNDGDFIYCKKNNTGISMLGIGDSIFQQEITLVPLPLSFGTNLTEGPILALDSIIGGSIVDFLLNSQGLSASLLTFGQAHVADSLSIQVEIINSFNADADGIVKLPEGDFDAVRVKIERTTTPNINVYCIDTINGSNSGWYSLNFGGGSSDVELSYQWYSNSPLSKYVLVELNLDSMLNVEKGVTYLSSSSTLTNNKKSDIKIYPNPATNNIEISCTGHTRCTLFNISGQKIRSFNFIDKHNLSVEELPVGVYIIDIRNNNSILKKKVVIE